MSRGTSIVIVGGGVAGLSTAWHLAQRKDLQVVLLEREAALGTHSSSKNAAILRTATGDPVERELAHRGARFLHDPPPGFAPAPLVRRCGLVLTAGERRAAELSGWIEGVAPEIPVEELSQRELERRAPYYRTTLGRAWLFPHEGRLATGALVAAYADGARRGGVRIETGVTVRELTVSERGAVDGVLLADGRRLEADVVVLAAGGWAGALGRRAGSRLALRPTQRHLLVTAPGGGVQDDWPVVWGLEDGFYARPEAGGLLLCACDEHTVDPDQARDDPAVEADIRAKARRLVPGQAALPTARYWHGLRTFTADGRFALGFDPDVQGLFWVAGLGGAGMVTSAEVGRLASAALAGEPDDDPLARRLDPARFAAADAG